MRRIIVKEAVNHSRFNRDHFMKCQPCYEDHIDFVEQCRIDEQDEVSDEQD